MRYKLKYIIVKHKGQEQPIIFSEVFDHSYIAHNKKVISAGECSLPNEIGGEISCYGESTTLDGLKSRGEIDSKIIGKYIYDG
jgi:hypothetical protein